MDVCIKSLVPGKPIRTAYQATKEFIHSKDPVLATKIHTNLGFGIGSNIKEELLVVNESNETVVQSGMVFHVRVTLVDVHKKPARGVIAIGDTVVIEGDKPNVITGSVQRKYTEISYSLD